MVFPLMLLKVSANCSLDSLCKYGLQGCDVIKYHKILIGNSEREEKEENDNNNNNTNND